MDQKDVTTRLRRCPWNHRAISLFLPWFLLFNGVGFDPFSSCSFAFAGIPSFLIGTIGGWPRPIEYLLGERRVNSIADGGAVGVPASPV